MTPEQMPEEWKRKNQRRIRLIDKDLKQGLTTEEAAELRQLEQEVFAHVAAVFPRPLLTEEQLRRLEARLGAEAADRPVPSPAAKP